MSCILRHRVLENVRGLRYFKDQSILTKGSVSCTDTTRTATHFIEGGMFMSIGRACAYMLMVGGILLFTGGASQADQSKSGTQKSGTQSGGTMGSESGSGGGSSGTMKQGHESSGKMGQNSPPITESDPGGIVTRGGRGDVPSSSKVDPLGTDQRDDSTKSGPGGVSGSKDSSGGKGSYGGASGGAGR